MKKCVLLWVICLIVSGCFPCAAEEATMKAVVTGRLESADRLSQEGVLAANRVLERLQLHLWAYPDGEKAALYIDGRNMWQMETLQEDESRLVIFSGTDAYKTEAGQTDALGLLGAESENVPSGVELWQPEKAAEILFSPMEGTVKPTLHDSATAIDNAGESARYDVYQPDEETMNRIWPDAAEQLCTLLFPEGGYEEACREIKNIRFTGKQRFLRLYDKSGRDMGIRLTGTARVPEGERKITLVYGYTENKGGSLTFSLSAPEGKDSLRITAALKEKVKEESRTDLFSFTLTENKNGEKTAFSLEGELLQAGESLSGYVQWTGKDGIQWRAEPALTVKAETSEGKIRIQAKQKKTTLYAFVLEGKLMPAGERKKAAFENLVDLTDKTAGQAEAAMSREALVLMRAVKYLFDGLTDEERRLLTHELRTDNWHTGPRVPVLQETEDEWILEDE